MNEIWKNIPDYPDYQASNMGRIRSKDRIVKFSNGTKRRYPSCILKGRINGKGYRLITPGVTSSGKHGTIGVHRLIAMTYIPNPQNKPFINHKDGNPLNNQVSNLEWATPEENSRHAKYILKNSNYGLPCQKIICIETDRVYNSIRDAWRDTGIHWTCIAKALNNKEGREQAGGYHWGKI